MIKLSSKRVLIRQPDGTKCPVELDALRADLEKSLVTAGVAEHWIADHVLGMVETLVTEGSVVAGGEAGLDRTISKILIDAGYPDVAASFADCRGVASQSPATKGRLPYDSGRILHLLGSEFSLSPRAADMLKEDVLQRLAALGFPAVADELILEVARHVLDARAKAHRAPQSQEAGGWLMPPGYWETCFSGDLAQLIRQGVLVVYPVSQLFPVARVNLRLRVLAETLMVSPLPVDLFVPSLVKACRLAAEAVARLREEAASLSGASGQHPGHLVVTELAPLLAGVLKVSRAKRKACRDALEAAIQEALKDRPPTQLILSVDAGLSKV